MDYWFHIFFNRYTKNKIDRLIISLDIHPWCFVVWSWDDIFNLINWCYAI